MFPGRIEGNPNFPWACLLLRELIPKLNWERKSNLTKSLLMLNFRKRCIIVVLAVGGHEGKSVAGRESRYERGERKRELAWLPG